MGAIDDLNAKIGELEAEVTAQALQIDEVVGTLAELKALLEQGTDAAVQAAIQRIDAQIVALRAKRGELDAAEEGADPTPDV